MNLRLVLLATAFGSGLFGAQPRALGQIEVRFTDPTQIAADQQQQNTRLSDASGGEVHYRVMPGKGLAPLPVRFEVNQANESGQYRWDFGDGSVSAGDQVTHTYYKPGTYTATLETSINGVESVGRIQISVADAGPERASMTVLGQGTLMRFDASRSIAYAPLQRVRWDFGDGSSDEGPQSSHEFKPGIHRVTLELRTPTRTLKQSLSINAGTLLSNPSFDDRVLELTNQARAKGWDCGSKSFPKNPGQSLPPLERNALLDQAATAQSSAMALQRYFDHQSLLDGSHPAERVNATGYAWSMVAENIAAGQPDPETVVLAWLRSSSHCKSIMNPGYSQIGLSYLQRPASGQEQARPFWTQVFTRPQR